MVTKGEEEHEAHKDANIHSKTLRPRLPSKKEDFLAGTFTDTSSEGGGAGWRGAALHLEPRQR